MNIWIEEEEANQLILCMKENARVVMSQLSSSDKISYECMEGRWVGETFLDLSIDIKRLCSEAYPTLGTASLKQACIDHFIDAIGAAIVKDVIRSKHLTVDKGLSEAMELEALELRAVREKEL